MNCSVSSHLRTDGIMTALGAETGAATQEVTVQEEAAQYQVYSYDSDGDPNAGLCNWSKKLIESYDDSDGADFRIKRPLHKEKPITSRPKCSMKKAVPIRFLLFKRI